MAKTKTAGSKSKAKKKAAPARATPKTKTKRAKASKAQSSYDALARMAEHPIVADLIAIGARLMSEFTAVQDSAANAKSKAASKPKTA